MDEMRTFELWVQIKTVCTSCNFLERIGISHANGKDKEQLAENKVESRAPRALLFNPITL